MRKNIRIPFFIIIFIFLLGSIFFWGIQILNYLNEVNINLFFFVFNWINISDEYLLNLNSFFLLSFGCLFWIIIIVYILNKNTIQIRGFVKTIGLFPLFWFNLILFAWFAGLTFYRNIWVMLHIFIVFWISLAVFLIFLIIILTLSRGIKSKFYARFQRFPSIKFVYYMDKYESSFLIFIQFILGFYLCIADNTYSTRIHQYYSYITPFIIVIFTIIAVDLLFLFNFILSTSRGKSLFTIKEKELFYQNRLNFVLNQTNSVISKETVRYSKRLLDDIINSLVERIENFKKSDKKQDKDLLRETNLSLIKAYDIRGRILDWKALRYYNKNKMFQAQKLWTMAVNDYESCFKLSRSEELDKYVQNLEPKITKIKNQLKVFDPETRILEIDKELKQVKKLRRKDLTKAIELVNNIIASYSEVKEKLEESEEFNNIIKKLEKKIKNAQFLRSTIQEKRDEDIGLNKIPAILKEGDQDNILSIIREYEFIGGQVRFKIGVINNTSLTFTNLKLALDLPIALKWIMHEPNYERKGDSLLLNKLGPHEKQAVSLYLEPVNCMESSVNVTVSFLDAKEKPHAIPMRPKMIGISCPIFFTEDEANLARVKSLVRSLANRDKKVFPIGDPKKGNSIFSSLVSVLGKFDIKLIYKAYDDENNFGEAWFYGMTKVKKQRIIPYVMLDGENRVLELEVSGDEAEQITAFLAEVSDRMRKKLILEKIIKPDEKFYDMRITVMSHFCPYCYTLISNELVQKFLSGDSIQCENCYAKINLDEK
ncbi:MAG: hypothetical protein ACFFCV_11405 [Promethearchaeota archaeon]